MGAKVYGGVVCVWYFWWRFFFGGGFSLFVQTSRVENNKGKNKRGQGKPARGIVFIHN